MLLVAVCISWPNFINSQHMTQKISSKMNFEVDGMVRNTKNWIFQERNMTLPKIKKFSKCAYKTLFSEVKTF